MRAISYSSFRAFRVYRGFLLHPVPDHSMRGGSQKLILCGLRSLS